MKKDFIKAAGFFALTTVLCGAIYTGVVTGISQLIFPGQANGSIIEVEGVAYGSSLLGQQFKGEQYLWGRMMNVDVSTYENEAGEPLMYGAPSNLSPAGEAFEERMQERIQEIKAAHPEMGNTPIPVDLVTCSGSGLDPQISRAAAEYQVQRLAEKNGKTEEEIRGILDQCTEKKLLGVLGEETVNVLKVNLILKGIL